MIIEDVVSELILLEPFLGHFLLGVQKEFSEEVPTAMVKLEGINPKIYFNEKFMDTLTPDQHVGVMWHEVEHIVNFHMCPEHYEMFNDMNVLNIAQDMHINQHIPAKYLHEAWVLPSSFPKLNLPPFQDTKTYYDLLMQNLNSSKPDPKLKALHEFMQQSNQHHFDHSGHREGDATMGDLAQKQIEHQMKRVYEDNCNSSVGNVPSHLRGLLDKLYKKTKPALDWKAALRRFGSRSAKTTTKSTRHKVNKRFPDFPTIKIKPKQKIAVAIDTSGSVSDKELAIFFDQIDHMKRTGFNIEIIECDAQIGRIYEYKDRSQIGKITGGGGTCAWPVLDLISKNSDYNSVVYFTDGGLFDSQQRKLLKPVLWVITPNGTTNFKFDGLKIKMNNI